MPFKRLDTVPIGVETIIVFVFVFLFFYDQFKNIKEKPLHTNHYFWIAIGILLYLGGSFFFNLLANHMDPKQLSIYWDFSYLADILKNIFFGIALITYGIHYKAATNKNIPYLDMI